MSPRSPCVDVWFPRVEGMELLKGGALKDSSVFFLLTPGPRATLFSMCCPLVGDLKTTAQPRPTQVCSPGTSYLRTRYSNRNYPVYKQGLITTTESFPGLAVVRICYNNKPFPLNKLRSEAPWLQNRIQRTLTSTPPPDRDRNDTPGWDGKQDRAIMR